MGGENDRPNITGTFGRYSRIACSYRGLMAAVDRGAVALAVITVIRCFGESVDVLRTASVAVRVVTRGNRTGCDQSRFTIPMRDPDVTTDAGDPLMIGLFEMDVAGSVQGMTVQAEQPVRCTAVGRSVAQGPERPRGCPVACRPLIGPRFVRAAEHPFYR